MCELPCLLLQSLLPIPACWLHQRNPGHCLDASKGDVEPQNTRPSCLLENALRSEVWFLRGFVHDVAHEHEQMAKCMRRALALEPGRADAWTLRLHSEISLPPKRVLNLSTRVAECSHGGSTFSRTFPRDLCGPGPLDRLVKNICRLQKQHPCTAHMPC